MADLILFIPFIILTINRIYQHMHISRSTNYTSVVKTPTCFGTAAPSSENLKYKGAQTPIHQSTTATAAAAVAIGIEFCNC